ncbi:hypothetical protein EVAR_65718_1 [Eumeta japonica]|uniref:Uncharacterized protein n=1 Tax=Eumeta variegata TaxID=151549 RepID=A0A4C2A8G5_EUMVA|nr:hypothetical protein EVAR_65718_1 [Eumeta japonica]
MTLFVPSFEQTHLMRSRYGPIGCRLRDTPTRRQFCSSGFDHSSCDVFVDECLVLLDVDVTVQDDYGGFDRSDARSSSGLLCIRNTVSARQCFPHRAPGLGLLRSCACPLQPAALK